MYFCVATLQNVVYIYVYEQASMPLARLLVSVCRWEFVFCGMCALSMGPQWAECRPAGSSSCWRGPRSVVEHPSTTPQPFALVSSLSRTCRLVGAARDWQFHTEHEMMYNVRLSHVGEVEKGQNRRKNKILTQIPGGRGSVSFHLMKCVWGYVLGSNTLIGWMKMG